MASLSLGNGIGETWSFQTPEQQPTQLVATGTNASLTLGWSYGAEDHNNGNIQSATIVGNGVNATQQFTYDSINRLTAANEAGGWSQGYNYDAFGNLTGGAATGIAAAFPGSISATNNQITDPGWSYDPAGNVKAGPAATSITYDAENRQVSYTPAGLAAASYLYDGKGRRVRKIESNGATTTYVYDAMGQLAAEYDTGAPAATGTQYLTADQLGSTRMLTDANGNPVACHDYQPFGAEIGSGINSRGACYYTGTDNPKQKFTGKERDAETGLDYFGARYFSGAQGRFTTPDWSVIATPVPYAKLSNPQSLNLYTYVLNNPLGFADPDGHFAPLSDDEETRKRQLDGYKHAVGKQAGAYLYDNKVDGKHYVGIYTNGPDGNGPSFESINKASEQIGAIIGDQSRELRIKFVPQETEIGGITVGSRDAQESPAVTTWSNGGRTATVNVTSGFYGELPGEQMSDGKSGLISFAYILSHEAGHAYSSWYLGDSAGKGNSVRMENVTRQIDGGPTRMYHDKQGDVGKTTF
jgi:RHS repeat-associated protein